MDDKDRKRTALISVMNKGSEVAQMASLLFTAGWRIVASSGTKKYLEETVGIKVVETSEFTNLKPVLGHRVVTLCPQLHGGLLAEQSQFEELAALGWPKIDLIAVTFYPLVKTLENPEKSSAQVNEATDIGGPAMVRSACKGGRIVLTREEHFVPVAQEIHDDGELDAATVNWLHAVAASQVAVYQANDTLHRVLKIGPERLARL